MRQHLITTVTRVTALGLLAALATMAAAPAESPRAHEMEEALGVTLNSASALFHPRIGGEAVSLTVSCAAGAYVHEEYAGTPTITFELIDQDGLPIADGHCRWEARIHPPVDRDAARQAEEADDDRLVQWLAEFAQSRTVVKSGSFEVAAGAIVSVPDSVPEAGE